jgi:hypothetical protein
MVNALDTKEKVMNDLEKGWNEVAQKLLLGKKIVSVRYMSKEEMDDMGWYVRTVAFQTEDGLWFFPSRDDEGNDGGALFTSDEKHSCLPVM